ncbi:MAG: nuclear transport factor 2 family protein [Verrucomicrobiota bacterium]
MTASYLIHPLTTFVCGAILSCGVLLWWVSGAAERNRSEAFVKEYKQALVKVPVAAWDANSPEETVAVERFKEFLRKVGDVRFVSENARKVYSDDAFLDDTLVVHHGAAAIEKYFLKTATTVSAFKVQIDDVSRSGSNYYVRWTMEFAAPALSGGELVHSVGISQIRFNPEGKVAFHQDFWDSGKNFYAHLPVVGGVIGLIRRRLQIE